MSFSLSELKLSDLFTLAKIPYVQINDIIFFFFTHLLEEICVYKGIFPVVSFCSLITKKPYGISNRTLNHTHHLIPGVVT